METVTERMRAAQARLKAYKGSDPEILYELHSDNIKAVQERDLQYGLEADSPAYVRAVEARAAVAQRVIEAQRARDHKLLRIEQKAQEVLMHMYATRLEGLGDQFECSEAQNLAMFQVEQDLLKAAMKEPSATCRRSAMQLVQELMCYVSEARAQATLQEQRRQERERARQEEEKERQEREKERQKQEREAFKAKSWKAFQQELRDRAVYNIEKKLTAPTLNTPKFNPVAYAMRRAMIELATDSQKMAPSVLEPDRLCMLLGIVSTCASAAIEAAKPKSKPKSKTKRKTQK